jgi:hypothetical protein
VGLDMPVGVHWSDAGVDGAGLESTPFVMTGLRKSGEGYDDSGTHSLISSL